MGIFDWLFGEKKAILKTRSEKNESEYTKTVDAVNRYLDSSGYRGEVNSKENNAFQKKLTNWDDVDFYLMEFSAEYRIKIIREVLKIEGKNNDAYYQWQTDLRRAVKLFNTEAIKTWEQVLTEYYESKYKKTEKDTKWWAIGTEIRKEKDLVKQNILIDNELDKDPDNFNLYNRKAYNLYNIGKVKDGISEVLKAITMNPNLAGFYDTAGEGYCMLDEYEKAIDIMSKGIEIAPDGMCPDGKEYRIEDHYYNRGMAYLKLQEFENAKKDFIQTLVIDIGFKKAMYALKEIPGFINE